MHHTVSPNDYTAAGAVELLRGIHAFHTGPEKGWPDIAYNFFVDRFGTIYEGRTGSLERAVAVDATGGSQGFAQLGCFLGDHSTAPPSGEAVAAMGELLGWLASRFGISLEPGATATFTSRGSNRWPAGASVTTPTISGHRDMSQTACPGDAAYALVADGTFASLARGAAAPVETTTSTTAPATTSTTAPTTTAPPTTAATAAPPPSSTEQAATAPATEPTADTSTARDWAVPAAATGAVALVAALIGLRRRRL